MKKNSIRRINSLQGLRFWMIFIIMLSHLEFLEKYPYGEFYYKYLHNARLGVDYFFVISGFGMMWVYGENNNNKLTVRNSIEYAIRKIKKIYPLFVFSLIISLPYIIYEYIENEYLPIIIIRNLFIKFIAALSMFQSATAISSFSHAINGVGWFISTLFIIYLFSPLMLKLAYFITEKKEANKIKLEIFLVIIIVCILWNIFIFIEKYTFFDDLSYGSPYFRVMYVFLGMLLAQLKKKTKPLNGIYDYFSIVISVVWFAFRNVFHINEIKIFVDLLIVSLLIYAISGEESIIAKKMAREPWVTLGEMGMYLYLLHYPLRYYVEIVSKECIPFYGEWWYGIFESIVIITLSIYISIRLYKKGFLAKKL